MCEVYIGFKITGREVPQCVLLIRKSRHIDLLMHGVDMTRGKYFRYLKYFGNTYQYRHNILLAIRNEYTNRHPSFYYIRHMESSTMV